MASGIRATVGFSDRGVCPIVDLSDRTGATITDRSDALCAAGCDAPVTEFSMDDAVEVGAEVNRVFSHGGAHRYRVRHPADADCPCVHLGRLGCPVARYVVEDGHATIVFHVEGYEQLREVIGELREAFPSLDIRRFVREPTDSNAVETVVVDRGRLTDRQQQVLRTAYERGYFERPRRITLSELAAELDVDASTIGEHVAAAEAKLIGDVFDESP